MSAYDAIREKLAANRIVLLDGAIGTEILRRNVSWADHQVINLPAVVRAIHEDYINAGADVITTNTFQLSRRSLLHHFRDLEHARHIGARDLESRAGTLLGAAVRLAIEARERVGAGRAVAIAGSITTLEWCFRPDLAPPRDRAREEYREIVAVMAKSGVDLILLETFNSVGEAKVALEVVRESGLPAWVGFVCDASGRLFSGETLAQAVSALEPLEPDAILLNCAPPDDITAGLRELTAHRSKPTGAFAHIGRFDPPEWLFTDEYPPAKYLACARRWIEMGARVIGGCCGTTPDHIRELKRSLTR
ncbi:MAG TPA: homocysteine S-methyltransferase family protein [Candidatus Acidoferrales bacterium]|nr:homocysteine S-methyltransferase family protein [Candidatus Acidoferrales bacterium]